MLPPLQPPGCVPHPRGASRDGGLGPRAARGEGERTPPPLPAVGRGAGCGGGRWTALVGSVADVHTVTVPMGPTASCRAQGSCGRHRRQEAEAAERLGGGPEQNSRVCRSSPDRPSGPASPSTVEGPGQGLGPPRQERVTFGRRKTLLTWGLACRCRVLPGPEGHTASGGGETHSWGGGCSGRCRQTVKSSRRVAKTPWNY